MEVGRRKSEVGRAFRLIFSNHRETQSLARRYTENEKKLCETQWLLCELCGSIIDSNRN